jgi:DNA end-binding protein Ku
MARALWKGTLTFGLVTIPVELHTAVRDSRPRFRLLHKDDQEPIKYERVCQKDGTPVAWEDLVKGYEYEKGQFVVLTKDDFQTAALERSRTILILDFVNGAEIDERFFETPYYLVPTKGGERSYQLLREALRATGRTGIAKYIMRTTQHLAAIDVVRDVIVLTTMRFAEELVDPVTLLAPRDEPLDSRELRLARQLVEGLSAEWAPEKYKDEYRENLMRVIRAKVKGRKPVLVDDTARRDARVVDLMERLRASLAQTAGTRGRTSGRKPARQVTRAAATRKKRGAKPRGPQRAA